MWEKEPVADEMKKNIKRTKGGSAMGHVRIDEHEGSMT